MTDKQRDADLALWAECDAVLAPLIPNYLPLLRMDAMKPLRDAILALAREALTAREDAARECHHGWRGAAIKEQIAERAAHDLLAARAPRNPKEGE